MTSRHCWKIRSKHFMETHGLPTGEEVEEYKKIYGDDGVCLLEDGHEGEHKWTPTVHVARSLRR